MKPLKSLFLIAAFTFAVGIARGQTPLVFDAATLHTLTPLHEQMLSKYGTWVGLRALCQEKERNPDIFFTVGFHLINAPDVLNPLAPQTYVFTDPVIFSITQARKNFVEEKAKQVATEVALVRPQECERYESIEREAISFFRVKGVLDVAQQTYLNFKNSR